MCQACVKCGIGKYKPAPSGTGNCTECTNKPANSVYRAWTPTEAASTASCPWICNAGYYLVSSACVACPVGKYSASAGATACTACTNGPTTGGNFYYLQRASGVVTTSNACPWDCSAGYRLEGAFGATVCVLCEAGKYREAGQNNLVEGGPQNGCLACASCVAGSTYRTRACSATLGTQCASCRTSCNAGQYMASPCTVGNNTACQACVTRCPVGYRMSVTARCSGRTTTDEVLAGCVACKAPGDCQPGYYLNRGCVGTETESNQCVACSVLVCPADQYSTGCGGYNNTRCLPFTQCGAGFFLADEARDRDGVCRACSTCEQLSVLRPCSRYDDAVCRGPSCGEFTSCPLLTAQNRSAFFCDYTFGPGREFCGVCPHGYGGDGQYCLECPRGSTCNRVGEAECQGQCGPGVQSRCESVFGLGYAVCDRACELPAPDTRLPWRGSYVRAESYECASYFLCRAGYYKKFSGGGTVGCEECLGLPVGARWVTEGLSVGDGGSCLWECKREVGRAWNATGNNNNNSCTARNWTALPALNEAGRWLAPDATGEGSACGVGLTSEARTAMSPGECLACPALTSPDTMRWVARTLECEWECVLSNEVKRGGRCVALEQGRCANAVQCQRKSFPLNRPGYAKVGWGGSVNVSQLAAAGEEAGDSAGVTWATRGWGVTGRHTVTAGGVTRNVPGAVCSAALATLEGGRQYVLAALCNQSFLMYVDVSSGVYGVLIGNGTARGWRDGFRTQALFENELYVAWAGQRTLYVLDRWNCLVREVVVEDVPGSYLTRAYTLWGNTEDLVLHPPRARCYGVDALAWPRRWWALPGGEWLAFADEDGLWQMHTGTKELRLIVREAGAGFEADALEKVTTDGPYVLALRFAGGAEWRVTAAETACDTGFTSAVGGDCTLECPWLDSSGTKSRYVDRSTGECLACTQALACGVGSELVPCSAERDAYCRGCAAAGNTTFAAAGTCDAGLLRRLPPCEAGSYLVVAGYCELCPAPTRTRFGGAVRVEQCKCPDGLSRRGTDGACVSERLYEFEVCAAGCVLPARATRLAGGDACRWACNTGFYRDTLAGFGDQCRPCLGGGTRTRGDDDSPWSCE